MARKVVKGGAVTVALVAAVAVGYVYRGRALAAPPAEPAAVAAPAAVPPVQLPDFSAIVQRYGPAVVNVSTVGTVRTAMEGSPFGQLDPDDPFFQFFRHFQPPQGSEAVPTRGLGSGFIVQPDGVILTNAHVVDGASEIRVKLTDKREFPAKVVGVDKVSDVAVLRIDAKGLPTVKLGEASRLHVGQWVLAIGSPFGFENSATAGIVSGQARSLPDEGYVPFLQTDVAVNPGNSGGPLFDAAGEVVGINSQIYSRSGGYMGLSFAIPIEVAMNVEHQLLTSGKVTRGWLGVTVQDVNQSLGDSFGLPRPGGALVSSIAKGGPAARAGLKAGDVILALDGQPVSGSADLPPRVATLAPGTEATLQVWRDRHQRDVELRIGEAPGAAEVVAAGQAPHGRLGLTVRPLTPEERRQEDVKGGVLVEEVNGPAARAGLKPGDVVLALNGTQVTSVDQLKRLASKSQQHVALLVQRGESRLFVPIDLG